MTKVYIQLTNAYAMFHQNIEAQFKLAKGLRAAIDAGIGIDLVAEKGSL